MDELKNIFLKKYGECITIEEQIKFLNNFREFLKEISPQKDSVENIQWVKIENIKSNSYNPNITAKPEMKLLYESIKNDTYTMPIVCYKINENEYEIVDGFHRSKVLKEHEDIKNFTHGYMPISIIDKPLNERIGSTIRHNRARGEHQVLDMSKIVVTLSNSGWEDKDICEKLGMDKEEVFKLKQVSGLKEAFFNHEFSKSWEEMEDKYYPDEKNIVNKTISKRPIRK
jgi:hypothetical protein